MRRLARWIVAALPLDDRGRRAMDIRGLGARERTPTYWREPLAQCDRWTLGCRSDVGPADFPRIGRPFSGVDPDQTLGLVGWLVPYGFQHHHKILGRPLWVPLTSSRTLSELTLPELRQGATTWAFNAQASAQWLLRRNLLLVATGPALILLASAYRYLRPWVRLAAIAGTVTAYVLATLLRHDTAGFLAATVIVYFLIVKRVGAASNTMATG